MRTLTAYELWDLTGYVQPARQSRWLHDNGIKHFRRRDGSIRVTWELINAVQHDPDDYPTEQGPDYAAVRG